MTKIENGKQTEPEPEAVRRGREAMGQRLADFADPNRPWSLHLQCAGLARCSVAWRPIRRPDLG